MKVKAWYEEFLVWNTRENKSEIEHRWDNEKGAAWKMLRLKLRWGQIILLFSVDGMELDDQREVATVRTLSY